MNARALASLIASLVLASVGVLGCGSTAPGSPIGAAFQPSESSGPAGLPTESVGFAGTSSPGALALDGTWSRKESCEEIARLFDSLGLRTLGASYIIGIGFRSGSDATVAADTDMCRGATAPKLRTLTFHAGVRWTGTMDGQQVDDGAFATAGDYAILLSADPGDSSGTPDITIAYRISGTTVVFTVARPQPCSTKACIDQVAWAMETFQLGPWTRS